MKLKILIIILVFAIALWIGIKYGSSAVPTLTQPLITFTCDDGKSIWAAFASTSATLSLSDGRNIELPLTVSASGARYANNDESIVFWNKGTASTITEEGTTTFAHCETH